MTDDFAAMRSASDRAERVGNKTVYLYPDELTALRRLLSDPAPTLDVERLARAAWRLSNAAESLSGHAKWADDPAHRSWFPAAIADVDREIGLARAAAGPEPDWARRPLRGALR